MIEFFAVASCLYFITLLVYVARIHHELKTMRKDFIAIALDGSIGHARRPQTRVRPDAPADSHAPSPGDAQWYQDDQGQWYQA